MIEIITYACHVAYLDPMTGEGLFVLPKPEHDVKPVTRLAESLHGADWNHAMRDLHRRGWEPSEDDDGGTIHVGMTADGRDVIGLYGREPVISMPSIEQVAEATRDLFRVARMVTDQRLCCAPESSAQRPPYATPDPS